MRHVSDDPRRFVSLSEMAGLFNEFFNLDDGDHGNRISEPTPYIWWHRSKSNVDISLPMPRPSMVLGRSGAERPFWFQEVLLHWYGAWRGIEVPVCGPAGDKVNLKGRRILSEYRTR